MASYRLEWKPSCGSDFKKIDRQFIPKIIKKSEALRGNPYPRDVKKLSDSEEYRIRVGKYRVIYQVDNKEKLVVISKVRHRKDAYGKR